MEVNPQLHQALGHRRNKSSIFKSIIPSNTRSTSPSKTGALSTLPNGHYAINNVAGVSQTQHIPFTYDSVFEQHVLGERVQNENAPPKSPRKMRWPIKEVSQVTTTKEPQARNTLKAQKSTTKLAAFFSKAKEERSVDSGVKENRGHVPLQQLPESDIKATIEAQTHSPLEEGLEEKPILSNMSEISKEYTASTCSPGDVHGLPTEPIGLGITTPDHIAITAPRESFEKFNVFAGEAIGDSSTMGSDNMKALSTPASSTQSRGGPGQRRAFDEPRADSTFGYSETMPNVKATVAMFNEKSAGTAKINGLLGRGLESAFEAILASRDIPESMRTNMRSLDDRIKADLVKYNRNETPTPKPEPVEALKSSFWKSLKPNEAAANHRRGLSQPDDHTSEFCDASNSPSKRHRSRSRAPVPVKNDSSPSKRVRSCSRSRSLFSLRNLSSTTLHTTASSEGITSVKEMPAPLSTPDEFVRYLHAEPEPPKVEIGKMHKLRLLVRNETVEWVEDFIVRSGMELLLTLLERIVQIEWRDEHDDLLLYEVLLCLKGLCTTQAGLEKLAIVASSVFPNLLKMIFDDDRKGPSEFKTRGVVINLMFAHLASTPTEDLAQRAKSILGYLTDLRPPEEEVPHGFIQQMHKSRPYKAWCKEATNVTKEVFWIFLHHMNVVQLPIDVESLDEGSYTKRYFPHERTPIPAAAWVGGVEWDATNYIAAHLDLLNGLIASFSSRSERNALRADLEGCGFEKLMGGTLRLCKEKFYSVVHDGLRTWVAAAAEDGWNTSYVRKGPFQLECDSPSKSPKKDASLLPKLNLPSLNLADAGNIGIAVEWL